MSVSLLPLNCVWEKEGRRHLEEFRNGFVTRGTKLAEPERERGRASGRLSVRGSRTCTAQRPNSPNPEPSLLFRRGVLARSGRGGSVSHR